MKTTMKLSMFALVAGLFAVTFSGCSKDKPPTEKEVEKALKKLYETCIPSKEWDEKKEAIEKSRTVERRYDCPSGVVGEECKRNREEHEKKYEEEILQKEREWDEWREGKVECGSDRKETEDRFISFKKTDGGYDYAQTYTIYGKITFFNKDKNENEESNSNYRFEKRESGWQEVDCVRSRCLKISR